VGALLYLAAAYYAEGAFKETLLGLFLLAFVLHLEEVRDQMKDGRWRWGMLCTAAILTAGAIYVYSYLALAWFGLTLAIWLGAEVLLAWKQRGHWMTQIRPLVRPAAVAVAVLIVLVAPNAGRIFSFVGTVGVSPSGTGAITQSNLGNLAHSLSPYEALGIWNTPDFRFEPANVFLTGELSAFALCVLLGGLAWSLSRRDLVVPAAVAASAIVYWRASHGQSPYVAAKALVIPAPVIAIAGLRALLGTPARTPPRSLRLLRFGAATAFVVLALGSSYRVLQSEPVWSSESTSELLSLDKLTHGQTVLFLGNSDYAPWLFSDSLMSALAPNTVSMGQAALRPSKPFAYGDALDFDSVDPSTINRFHWVVTPNTTYASAAPAGFRLTRRLPMYELWERTVPVGAREVLDSADSPGAVLDCHSRKGRALSHQRGIAAAMDAPVTAMLAPVTPGSSDIAELRLPAGTWQLSLQYTSAVPLEVHAAGHNWHMPAYVDRPGPFFALGNVRSSRTPTVVAIKTTRPSFATGANLIASLTRIAAVRTPDTRVLVPLAQACGRYIDWYRLAG
jgi:hypothetical protein